jgi:hypothetical protein
LNHIHIQFCIGVAFSLSDSARRIAIKVIWYGGQMMGEAVSNALTGAVSPSGRSPFTWPTGANPGNAYLTPECAQTL